MEPPTAAPTTAPASSAPPPSAPASTPAPSSPPSTQAKYGEIPRSKAQEIWDQIDQGAGTKTPEEGGATTPDELLADTEIPVAGTPEITEPAPPVEPAVVDPSASPNEATLPPKLRDSLKAITDPKVRAYLADSAHMRATFQKTGLPFAQLNQFIAEAPQYLQKAPTLDVLDHIATTAEQANAISSEFMAGTDEGFKNFNQTLLEAGPVPFVQNLGFLFNNLDAIAGVVKQNFGDNLYRQIEQFRDGLIDRGVSHLIAKMRAEATEGGDKEVLGEVADELEKYTGLKERVAARAQPRRADPRDLRIQALETEKERAVAEQREHFASSVFSQAGGTIEKNVTDLVTKKGSGFTQEAREELSKAISDAIYNELLNNPNVVSRVKAIDAAGKWDQAHQEQRVKFYESAAERLLGTIAPPMLKRMAQLTSPGIAQRQQKVAAQIARKDPGASGSPPRPRVEMPKSSNPKEIFDHLDQLAAARTG
jgi:hypothetical protein